MNTELDFVDYSKSDRLNKKHLMESAYYENGASSKAYWIYYSTGDHFLKLVTELLDLYVKKYGRSFKIVDFRYPTDNEPWLSKDFTISYGSKLNSPRFIVELFDVDEPGKKDDTVTLDKLKPCTIEYTYQELYGEDIKSKIADICKNYDIVDFRVPVPGEDYISPWKYVIINFLEKDLAATREPLIIVKKKTRQEIKAKFVFLRHGRPSVSLEEYYISPKDGKMYPAKEFNSLYAFDVDVYECVLEN